MAVKSTAAPVAEPTASWENPLIPTERLRALYAAMVELRLLEEHLARLQRKKSLIGFHRGEEGCLASTVLSLMPGDLTSEPFPSVAISFLRGSKLTELLKASPVAQKGAPSELPQLEGSASRLHIALGAAFALASRKKGPSVVAYLHAVDLTFQQWKPLLKLAANHAAPILFVVLPCTEKSAAFGKLSLASTSCGVPGITVDAADPVALYRVAQESLLRIRAGGGPVLMECIPFQLPGKVREVADPILTMQQFMLPRGVATERWFEEVATRFATRLKRRDR